MDRTAMNEPAHVSIIRGEDTVIAVGSDILDLTNYQQFHQHLKLASLTDDQVTVDLVGVQFIDTAVVQSLAKAAVTMLKRSNRLRVRVMDTAYPRRVLRLSGFHDIMDIDIVPTE